MALNNRHAAACNTLETRQPTSQKKRRAIESDPLAFRRVQGFSNPAQRVCSSVAERVVVLALTLLDRIGRALGLLFLDLAGELLPIAGDGIFIHCVSLVKKLRVGVLGC